MPINKLSIKRKTLIKNNHIIHDNNTLTVTENHINAFQQIEELICVIYERAFSRDSCIFLSSVKFLLS